MPSFILSFNKASYYIVGNRIRFIGYFNNPNELARFSALGFLIGARILPDIKKILSKMILIVLILIAIYIIYISDSRAAILLCGVSTAIFLFNWSYIKVSKRLTLLITVLILLTLFTVGIHKVIVEYRVLGFYAIDQLTSGRLSIWVNLLKEKSIMELIFGIGSHRSGLAATQILANGYIEVLMYFGLLGLLQWLGLVIYLLNKKIKSVIRNNNINQYNGIAIIIGFLIYFIFEGGLISVGNIVGIYFWLELSQTKA
jgi:O-antigen ligase